MRIVSPSGPSGPVLAPASSSRRVIIALPLVAASASGVTPYRFAAETFAPALTSSRTVSKSSARTAQWSAVMPSGSVLLTVERVRSVRTAALSPAFTASMRETVPPAAPMRGLRAKG